MLDDSGQKWFHTLEQLEIHRLFARARNPELESIVSVIHLALLTFRLSNY
jgi:hypothetical protein